MTFRRESMQGFAMNGHRVVFALGLIWAVLFGLSPQLAQAGAYADSAHGDASNGVDRSGSESLYGNYAPGNCAHCHEQHASLGGAEPAPGSSVSEYLLAASGNNLCAVCHGSADGNLPTGDVASQTTDTSGHDPATSYIGKSGTISATCVDCHDVHTALDTTHSEAVDGNTASGVLKNVYGIQADWTGQDPGTPSSGEALLPPVYSATESIITKEYELCLKCHSSYAFTDAQLSAIGWSDQGKEFNPFNSSFHPVTEHTANQPWNNQFLQGNYGNAMKSPWNTLANIDRNGDLIPDARMHCSDCHGDDLGRAVGPHGSNSTYILKATGNALCESCHNTLAGTNTTNFLDHKINGHVGNAMGCLGCHGGYVDPANDRRGYIHGSNYAWPSGYNGGTSGKFLVGGYITDLTATACWSSGCKKHSGIGY